jgi:hypothetical protein
MSETAEKTDVNLWETVKDEVTAGTKGGKKGQWSARKAQMAVAEYKKRGGGYKGDKAPDNSLQEWSEEDWGTASGEKSGDTGERYLPKAAREALSEKDYARTSAKKRADTKRGKQFSSQPDDVADKTRPYREHRSKADLYAEAKKRNISGRSAMSKDELAKALAG